MLSISGPNPRSKPTQPRGAECWNPFFSGYESDRANDVPLKARKTICSLREGTLHYLPCLPCPPGEIQSLEWQGQLLLFPGRKYYLREVVKFIHSCVTHSAHMQLCLLFAQRSGRCCITSLSYFCQNNCESAKMWSGKPVAGGLFDVKEDPCCSAPPFLFYNREPMGVRAGKMTAYLGRFGSMCHFNYAKVSLQ